MQLGYFYTDIKAQNILYKKVGSCFKVYLGDLGSATAQGSSATSTFPSPQDYYVTPSGTITPGIVRATERSLCYGLGVLALDLMGANIMGLTWRGLI